MGDSAIGVSRHVENPDPGMLGGELCGQFLSVHAGHDDVSQQQIHSRQCVSQHEGFFSAGGFEYLVTLLSQ